ncbi:Bifunctional ligase/repressor BirA [BD1-7 clade bacterium]|uniref:Bifunctional ligase/repressor BirA n=1 Tax=BD1-7 clade bacterium TaxID=2029982 RepID=A0A5S9N338_9GAMM|nr:Bifunctional ligase/repressor BirA [BD1-7 clade bacterium]CAA0083866.1 Bifunctional ligase/repressor BirA [BD1-7 clade bacterium]
MQKNIPFALIGVLADGEFHSGEAIGQVLGVSRAAVWKQLHKLEELGVDVDSVKGRGYRLQNSGALLNPDEIRGHLVGGNSEFGSSVDVCWELDSTNAEMLRRLQRTGALPDAGDVIVAESQTAGRGRRGRSWVSPVARNIYASMVWSFEGGVGSLDGLSLVVGLSVVEMLGQQGFGGVQLKWPNDVLWQGKKLAGILLEISGDPTGVCHVVIGVGINVNMRPAAVGAVIDQPWTSLSQIAGKPIDRNALLASLVERLKDNLAVFSRVGFSKFRERWLEFDAFFGKDVVVLQGGDRIFGVCNGIDARGNLMLDVGGRMESFNGGEVSLRASPGDI